MLPTEVPALILAGGASSRMGGGDKPLLALRGEPILAHIVRRLSLDHAVIAVSANGDPARFGSFGLPILSDERSVGPLAGILAGLLWARAQSAEHLLTVPGDGPFLPPRLAASLHPAPAMAMSNGRRHPTVALWPTAAATALETHLATLDPLRRRDHSVVGFAAAIGMRVVPFDVLPADPFFNINTPEDLARAEACLAC